MKGFKEKQELIEAQRKGMPLQEIFLRLFFSNFLLHQEIFFYQKEIFVLKEQISKDRQEHFETTLSASEEKELEVSFVFSKCCLSQLNTITEEVIEELNSYLLSFLILDHLKSLNKETALALSLFKGEYLSLNSLQSLNPQILQEICQLGKSSVFIPKFSRTFFKLVLNSIAEVNEEIVEIFSHECFIKNLYLGGITSFRDSVLKRLCESPRIKKLSLNGLQKLDENQAEILSQFKGIGLELDGLKTLEIKVAQKLFQFQEIFSFISLNGLGELEEGVAEALSLWTPTPPLRPLPFLSKISLSGLNVLQRKELEALSCWKGFSLCFNGLKELKSDILPFFSQLEVEQLQLKGLEYLELETVSRLNFSKINSKNIKFRWFKRART
jgi:hypothetical protein